MRTRLFALAATTAALLVGVLAVPAPVRADPPPTIIWEQPNKGSSGEWRFDNDHQWHFSTNLWNASVTGTGYDDDNVRVFQGTLTDSTTSDNFCAYFTFAESAGAATVVACNETVPFSHIDTTPATYTFELEVRNTWDTWHSSAKLIIPSTKYHTALRSDGVGAKWERTQYDGTQFEIIRPHAYVEGHDGGVYNHGYSRKAWVTTYAFTCARTQVFDHNPIERGSADICNSSQTLAVEQLWRWFEVKTCLVEPIIAPNGTVGRPGTDQVLLRLRSLSGLQRHLVGRQAPIRCPCRQAQA